MLGIQINGEFLDLLPGTTMELQRENPFLQFTEQLTGEYSYPFQVRATEKNLRLLNYAGVVQRELNGDGIDALIYDNAIQTYAGKIKIEKASIDLNKTSKGLISCFFLTGSSGFWQEIKDKKMRELSYGGSRSFDWVGPSTLTAGFWKHIHQVTAGEISADYAFFPVINTGWPEGVEYPPIMNLVYYDPMQLYPVSYTEGFFIGEGVLPHTGNRIVPFPYLKYIITKAFESVGWTVSGDILSDATFLKICMINFRAIDWVYAKVSSGVVTQVYRDPVVFDLKDHMPDITFSSFLIALKNRFGWWYDFDNSSKIVTIRTLQSLTAGAPMEMTTKSSPLLTKNITQEKPVYALRNNFVTDIGSGAPDFKVISYQGEVDKTTDLPAAGEAIYGHVYLVREENNFYICHQNPEDEVWQWYPYTYNIYDYEPAGANADIITDATLVGLERFNDYLDLIPRIDNEGEWVGRTESTSQWGIHLAFNFGLRDNKSGDPVPFGTTHMYDSQGFTLADWSLAFRGERTVTAEQMGLYDKNWKEFLAMISGAEEVEHVLYLPMHEYLKLKFSDRIVIAGVMLFIKTVKSNLPYKGSVSCVSIRV